MKIVLILEDDIDTGRLSAMAGLVPNGHKIGSASERAELAGRFFKIIHAENVKQAIDFYDQYRPDLVILDIHMLDGDEHKIDGKTIVSGLDVFRHLDEKGSGARMLLFSDGAAADTFNQLSDYEESRFRTKSQLANGGEHQVLAKNIHKEWEAIARELLAAGTYKSKKQLLSHLEKAGKKWERDCGHLELETATRSIRLEHLLVFKAEPVFSRDILTFKYNITQEEVIDLIKFYMNEDQPHFSRVYYGTGLMQRNLDYFQEQLLPLYGKEIEETCKRIILKMAQNTGMAAHKRIGSTPIPFRLISYFEQERPIEYRPFLQKFNNALAIKRALLFFEDFFTRECDSDLLTLHDDAEEFKEEFITHIFKAIHAKDADYSRNNYLNAHAISVNLRFGRNDERETITPYEVYPFEKEWLRGNSADTLRREIKRLLKKQ